MLCKLYNYIYIRIYIHIVFVRSCTRYQHELHQPNARKNDKTAEYEASVPMQMQGEPEPNHHIGDAHCYQQIRGAELYMYIYVYIYIHINTYLYMCIYVCIYTPCRTDTPCRAVYVYICMYIYI